MSPSEQATAPKRLILPKTLGLLALLAALTWAAVSFSSTDLWTDRCSPTEVRPWAAESFDELVAASPPKPWPTTSTAARRPQEVVRTEDSLTLKLPPSKMTSKVTSKPNWLDFERVEADASMRTVLSHGSGFTVELLYWHTGRGGWLSPTSGEELDPQPDRRIASADRTSYAFVLRLTGEAVRLHGGRLFDRRTKVSLSNSTSWMNGDEPERVVELNLSCRAAHRAELLLEVPLTYGSPEVQSLRLAEGATQSFGVAAEVQFLGRGPGSITSTFSTFGGASRERGIRWELATDGSSDGWAAFHILPQDAFQKLQARPPGESSWQGLHGRSQIPTAHAVPAAAESIELRYLPHAARVQFSLHPPSTLPVIENLLDVPLGRVELANASELKSLLAESLHVRRAMGNGLGFDSVSYPVVIDEATPRMLMELVRALGNPDVHVDTDSFTIAGKRSSMWSRAWDWLEKQAGRLGI